MAGQLSLKMVSGLMRKTCSHAGVSHASLPSVGCLASQFEHVVAITESGVEVLTGFPEEGESRCYALRY